MEGRKPTRAQNLWILQCQLLFRRPFPGPLGFSGFPAAGDRLGFRIFGFGVLGFGFWILDFGFWILDFGFWTLGFGFWVVGFGFWIWGFGFWIWVVDFSWMPFGFGVWDFGFWILGCWISEPKGLGPEVYRF